MAPPFTRGRSVSPTLFPTTFGKLKVTVYSESSGGGGSGGGGGRGGGGATAHHSLATLGWNPTGTLIATGGRDRSIRVWNPERPQAKHSTELRGHTGAIERVAFNPVKDAELASCSADGTVRLWDVRSKNCVGECKIGGEALTLAWRADGTELICGRKDDVLVRLSVPLEVLDTHPQAVQTNATTFTHSREHPVFFTTTGTGCLSALSYPALTPIPGATFVPHTSSIHALALSPTGQHLVTGGSDALMTIFTTADCMPTHTFRKPTGPIRSVDFSFDGSYIAAGSDEEQGIWIVHAETGEEVMKYELNSTAKEVAWHPLRYALAYLGDPHGLKIIGGLGGS